MKKKTRKRKTKQVPRKSLLLLVKALGRVVGGIVPATGAWRDSRTPDEVAKLSGLGDLYSLYCQACKISNKGKTIF